jgi:tetratricopeptide (TPR) repeat protein
VVSLFLFLFGACGGPKKTEKSATPDWRVHYSNGLEWQKKGRCKLAIEEYKKALALEPAQSVVQNFLGLAQYSCMQYTDAEESYKKALEINPYYTDVHNQLGILYSETRRLEEAEREFNEALRDKSYRTPELVHYNLGKLYYKWGRFPEAAEHLEIACERKPDMTGWRHQLCLIYERMGNFQIALDCYRSVLVVDPELVPSLYHAGLVCKELKKIRQARDYFNQVTRLAPNSEEARQAGEQLKMLGY